MADMADIGRGGNDELREWLNDPARRVGDHAAVQTHLGSYLASVFADSLGRLWAQGPFNENLPVMIFDPLEYESARDAGPINGLHPVFPE